MLPVDRTIIPHAIQQQRLIVLGRNDTVRAAARRMAECRIGALLVMEGDRLIGIVTERDISIRVVAAGRDPETTTIEAAMTTDPVTVTPGATVRDALELMADRHLRHLPVLEAGRVVGIVSIRDLYQSVLDQMSADIMALAEGLLRG